MRKWMKLIVIPLTGGFITASGWAQSPAPEARAEQVKAELDARAKAIDELRVAQVAAAGADGRASVWFNRKAKKEKAAFLGVVCTAADPALRDQLKLPRGIGLVVQSLEEKGPADVAGLQEHDILTKLDDQWLVNQPQLGVLVRMHKPDEEITLSVIRKGEPTTVKAKLIEKEMVIADSDGTSSPFWQTMNAAGQGGVTWTVPQGDFQNLGDVLKLIPEGDDADVIIKDNDRTLKISMKDNERHLVATDNNNQVLFDGPIETEDQRKSLPADLAEQIEKYKEQIDSMKDVAPGTHKKIRIIRDGR